MVKKHFRSNSINELDKLQNVKQFFTFFAVMSNFIEINRPYTIVINEENKNYFITKLDEQKLFHTNYEVFGLHICILRITKC